MNTKLAIKVWHDMLNTIISNYKLTVPKDILTIIIAEALKFTLPLLNDPSDMSDDSELEVPFIFCDSSALRMINWLQL